MSKQKQSKNKMYKKPRRNPRIPRPNDIPKRVRVIKMSFTNILIMGVTIIAALFLFNAYMQPSLGNKVDIDTFLNNIGDNEYARIDIRSDGNAVGFGKYIEVVSTEDEEVSEDSDNAQIEKDLEEQSLDELVEELKPADSFGESISDFQDAFSQEFIEEIIILDNRIIVDWNNSDKQDWLIDETTEEEFEEALRSENLDTAELTVNVTYLRSAGTRTDFSDFESRLNNDRYSKVWVAGDDIFARVSADKIPQTYVNFGVVTGDFTQFLQEEGINLNSRTVEFRDVSINTIDIATIVNIALIAALLFTGYILIRSLNGGNSGLMRFGQSKARMFFGQKANVTFDDVAGVDEAKQELKEVVDFLKSPGKYRKLGAKIPRGVIMVGEPGTGKTLMARAVAGEAGVPFFHTSGSEFEEMLVGAGASRVRDLFDKAKKAAPALIFIDEIDAVGRKRGTTIQSSSTEQTLNQILVEMDGFETNDNVIVVAATNRPDVLDPALLRPGRFDRKVMLDAPDIEGRKAILQIHSANKPLADNVDLEKVAKRTVGFSGADLENMLNEAAIIVAKENRKQITMDDIEEAATKVQAGPVRKRKRSDQELRMTAYHEAGHAIVMKMTPQSDPVHRITILSRGMALGYTMPLPQSDQLQTTKTKMESKIRSLLAGFVTEEMIFNDVTTGASNDIERATGIARKMVKRFGMSKKLGLVRYGQQDEEPQMGWGSPDGTYSDATAQMIDDEVRRIIQEAYDEAKQILEKNRDKLHKLADMLLENEVVEADEFEHLFDDGDKEKKRTIANSN